MPGPGIRAVDLSLQFRLHCAAFDRLHAEAVSNPVISPLACAVGLLEVIAAVGAVAISLPGIVRARADGSRLVLHQHGAAARTSGYLLLRRQLASWQGELWTEMADIYLGPWGKGNLSWKSETSTEHALRWCHISDLVDVHLPFLVHIARLQQHPNLFENPLANVIEWRVIVCLDSKAVSMNNRQLRIRVGCEEALVTVVETSEVVKKL